MSLLLLVAGLATATEVTWNGGGHAGSPAWSADGEWLAFEVTDFDGRELLVAHVVGGNPGPVFLRGPAPVGVRAEGGAVWHPKAPYLFYESAYSGNLVVAPRVLYVNAAMPGGAPTPFLGAEQAGGGYSDPAISPDGTLVAFASDHGGLLVYSRRTGKVTRVDAGGMDLWPCFTEDGTSLVFARREGGAERVYALPVGGGDAAVVGGMGDRPRVVGNRVIYFTQNAGSWGIANVSLAGGERTILVKDVQLPTRGRPSLTPDRTGIVYTRDVPEKDGSVFVTDLDGTRTREIETGLTAVRDPVMTNAGGHVWLAFTALPASGSDWRQLHVIEVDPKIVAAPSESAAPPAKPAHDAGEPARSPRTETRVGAVELRSEPPGADVYVDGSPVGKTPVVVQLAYGRHPVRVERSGSAPSSAEIDVRAPEATQTFTLRPEGPMTGQLNVYGPTGWSLAVDGHDLGAMPVAVIVGAGVRTFRIGDGATSCTIVKDIRFEAPGRPVTLTLACP